MEYYLELLLKLSPVLILIVTGFLGVVLFKSAKKRKGVAMAFGMMAQMFLPDPQVEKTIETIISAKRNVNEQEDQKDDK